MSKHSVENQLRDKLAILSEFIKNLDNFSSMTISPKVASILNSCRVCKKSTKDSRQLMLNFGEEFAHTECYEANK